jgi:SAM-dependent methyltransferase
MSSPSTLAKRTYRFVSSVTCDPILLFKKIASIPRFIINLSKYIQQTPPTADSMKIDFTELELHSYDRWEGAGSANGHYFWQDLWAAKEIYDRKISNHYDVGSRVDGFIAHILPFCAVTYVDLRPVQSNVPNLKFIQGSILELPFDNGTLPSLSCLHVIEHIGLGRYGDPIDFEGHIKAAHELSRVLAPGGILFLGTPVGKERVVFDGHRIFSPKTIIEMFPTLNLVEYKVITDIGDCPTSDPSFSLSNQQSYGCGLFIFEKHK